MNTIELFKTLESKIGSDGAQSLIEFVNIRVSEEVGNRSATKTDVLELKTELIKEMKSDKFDLIKWMFIFWAGQIAITMALLKFLSH